MGDQLKENYFTIVRIVMMLAFSVYGMIELQDGGNAGVSVRVLLLVSLFFSVMALKEMAEKKVKLFLNATAAALFIALMYIGGKGFIMLGCLLVYDVLMYVKSRPEFYVVPYLLLFMESPIDTLTMFILITMLMVFYMQYVFVVSPYREQMLEDTKTQQGMKRDMENREYEVKAEIKKNILMAENKVLEERANLSQTLHDKLGHNINGSIYQLEASKVVMDKDPDKARSMIQAVIDQLRTGMDEIRMILRKERPEKKKMALLQLNELCADCNEKGVQTEFVTEGDIGVIPNDMWEIILDNVFEAVTNSMKYSKATRIDIKIVVLNKMVKCVASDNGVGCDKIEDGMGISGMRQRVRIAGGTIDFETGAGFTVNMLLPLKEG